MFNSSSSVLHIYELHAKVHRPFMYIVLGRTKPRVGDARADGNADENCDAKKLEHVWKLGSAYLKVIGGPALF